MRLTIYWLALAIVLIVGGATYGITFVDNSGNVYNIGLIIVILGIALIALTYVNRRGWVTW